MSTTYFSVFDEKTNHYLGYVAYHNASDTWSEGVEDTTQEAYQSIRHCKAPEDHKLLWAVLFLYGCENHLCRLKYCPQCKTLVTPPHDGYVYHDYDCTWRTDGDPCTCGA